MPDNKLVPTPMILNVDDHEPGRYARSRLLTKAGYTVRETATGTEALELSIALRPALVVLDVNLPDLSGLEVCRRIKTHPLIASTPILHLSASAITPADCVGGLDSGADAYLIEPVDSDVLLATVRALLRMRKAEEELHRTNEALQAANAALVRSNEDLDRFAHVVSHDLQEPLRTVSSFASLLDARYRGRLDKDGETCLDHIQRGTAAMRSLIDKLLIYAQVGAPGENPCDHVKMEEVWSSVMNTLEHAIAEVDGVITHGPLLAVCGNQTQLAQLFQNLISNGLKFRRPEEPPRIHVSAGKHSGGMVMFSVSDNGVGIPPEHHEKIFAEFSRLNPKDVRGTGIGLATCKRIVERHGGRIWVETVDDGTGSIFRFLLPSA